MRKKRGPSRRGERPLRKRGGVHGAVGVVVGQGQRPRVALVGVVGVVREGFGAKEAHGAKRVYGGARRAWGKESRVVQRRKR